MMHEGVSFLTKDGKVIFKSWLPQKQATQQIVLRCLWTSYDYLTSNKEQDDMDEQVSFVLCSLSCLLPKKSCHRHVQCNAFICKKELTPKNTFSLIDRGLQSEEADKKPSSCTRKWNFNDFSHHPSRRSNLTRQQNAFGRVRNRLQY